MRKKVTVCMATYNGAKYIEEQLKSILPQLTESDEIIISDDHSKDNTIKLIEDFDDKRIKIFFNDGVRGLTYNFENAIRQATGEVIFLSDQDDIWLPNKVSTCLFHLDSFDVVVTNCSLVDNNYKVLEKSYFNLNKSRKGFFKNFYRSSYLGSCLAFNRVILKEILPFPKNLRLYHDWWIGMVADWKFKVYFIEEPLMLYRRHENTMSTTGFKSNQSISKRILDRLQLLYFTFKRF